MTTTINTQKAHELIDNASFTFAKTMAHIPHWWTCRNDWENKDDYDDLAMFIKKNGVVEKFYTKNYTYYYYNGYKYWHIGVVINRARV